MCSANGAAMLGMPSLSFTALSLSLPPLHFLSLCLSLPISDLLCVVLICVGIETVRFLVPHVCLQLLFLLSMAFLTLVSSLFTSIECRIGIVLRVASLRSPTVSTFRSAASTASCEWSKHRVDFWNNTFLLEKSPTKYLARGARCANQDMTEILRRLASSAYNREHTLGFIEAWEFSWSSTLTKTNITWPLKHTTQYSR